jgi:hypothetical protein
MPMNNDTDENKGLFERQPCPDVCRTGQAPDDNSNHPDAAIWWEGIDLIHIHGQPPQSTHLWPVVVLRSVANRLILFAPWVISGTSK